MLNKYFKPLSVTWWSGIVPLSVGMFVATANIHELQNIVTSINIMTNDTPASVMIIYGLTAIGLRGKDG